MAKYTGNVLTNKGKELLARAIVAGEIITFTKVEVGKGTAVGVKEELQALVDSFKVLSITSTTELESGSYRIRVAFSNAGITADTELKEIGVFARGEDGIEILYSYCDTNSPDLIPAENSGTLERVEDIITYISNAANINAVIDQSAVQATMQDLVEGLITKEDSFTKNTAHNKNFGTGNNEVARGNHGHSAAGIGALYAGNVTTEYNTGEKIENKIKALLTPTTLYDGSTTGLVTHEDVSNYDWLLFKYSGYGNVPIHSFLSVAEWLDAGGTYDANADDKNKNAGVAWVSNTETIRSGSGYSTLYKIIGYKLVA